MLSALASLVSALLVLLCTCPLAAPATAAAADAACAGRVHDGLLAHELDFQTSTTALSAHWTDFGDRALVFEWAAVSSPPPGGACIGAYRPLPDVFAWERTRGPFARRDGLRLQTGATYFVLVRATFDDGSQSVVRSDGVRVVAALPADSPDAGAGAFAPAAALLAAADAPPVADSTGGRQRRDAPVEPLYFYPAAAVCAYDQANRCRQINDRTAVADSLDALYGPTALSYSDDGPAATVFFRSDAALARQIVAGLPNPLNPAVPVDLFGVNLPLSLSLFGDTIPDFFDDPNVDTTTLRINARQYNEARDLYSLRYDDDADHHHTDLYEWIIAPGLAGVVLFFFGVVLIALIVVVLIVAVVAGLLLLLRALKGDGDSGSSRGYTGGDGGDDDGPSSFSRRGKAAAGTTDDKTNIEFPDTEIRRLSITHEDKPEATTKDGPKRNHPIMESSSSSFRDFRTANV